MKNFAIVTDSLSIEQERSFAAFMGESHFGFWHRMPNLWCLTTPDDITATSLVSGLKAGSDVELLFVFEVTNWYASTPEGWHDWFVRYWDADSEHKE